MHWLRKLAVPSFLVLLFACILLAAPQTNPAQPRKVVPDIQQRLDKFPQTVIDYDRSRLTAEEQKVVDKLIEASRQIHEIFLRQVAAENPEVKKELTAQAAKSAELRKGLRYFDLMMGRWDRLKDNEPFISPFGPEGQKPAGSGFYPPDLTKNEFFKWISAHPKDEEAFKSFYTVIDRQGGNLVAVPYSKKYAEFLAPAAKTLREAAALTSNESLKNFLNKRADAFLSNNYRDSDIAWVEVNSPVEVTIGPYEVYEDELLNMKASFESFVTAVDKDESEKLKAYTKHLPDMERLLPMPSTMKNPNRSTQSAIRVVDLIFTAGDARRGVQTSAFNLPNDDEIRNEHGSKNVLLKNVMKAKFTQSGQPIARRVLDPSQVEMISFDAYFNHTLFHELSHALGPGIIRGPDGKEQENRIYLQDLYSTIEECKADVLGIWNLLYAIDEKLITSFTPEKLFVTDAGLMFRGMRFGVGEAHGGGSAIQWNWYRKNGAIQPAGKGKFKVDPVKYRKAVESLANELLMIEATGDYKRAETLINNFGKETPEITDEVPLLKDIPVDIAPIYPAAGEKKQ